MVVVTGMRQAGKTTFLQHDPALAHRRDAKLPAATVGRYLGLLEISFLVERLPPFLRSRTTRLIKSPRIYLTDSGLAAHLTGARNLDPTSGEPLREALYETFVH